MPRPARIDFADAVYHVTSRGNARAIRRRLGEHPDALKVVKSVVQQPRRKKAKYKVQA